MKFSWCVEKEVFGGGFGDLYMDDTDILLFFSMISIVKHSKENGIKVDSVLFTLKSMSSLI